MKKSRSYKLIMISIAFFFIILISNSSKAASISISTSKSSVSPGESFSVTISVSGGAGKVNVSATNASLSKTTLDLMLQSSMTITCTAGNSGTISINASGVVADYSTENDANISASPKSVKIVQSASGNNNNGNSTSGNNAGKTETNTNPNTKSNVATLSNLGIKPNDFSGFKSGIYSYNVEVPNETESIEVYASKGQNGQTISGTGKKTLKEGTNTFNVVVTAEDGKNQKTYTINVTRKTKEDKTEETSNGNTEEKPEENTETDPLEEKFGLSELKIEGLEIEPQFQTDIYEYKVELKEDLDKLNITTLATKANATVEITGNENLKEGENIITILVKGENEDETAAYQIVVNKILEKQENTENNSNQDKIKKIIIVSIAGGIILVIVVVAIVTKIKKSKGKGNGYIPYENLMDDDEENDEGDEIEENQEDEEFYQEEPKKKKRSKGKRFK